MDFQSVTAIERITMGDALELRVIVVDEDLVDLNSFQGIETGPFRA